MICLCLTESRASKILMLDDHSYIDMAINCIPHVHPFWDNLQSPKPCVYWGSSCAGGVKDHDGWIYQSTGHFEWFCLPIWTIYHLDSFPVLLIHFNLKKKQRSLWIVTSEWCCDAAARGCYEFYAVSKSYRRTMEEKHQMKAYACYPRQSQETELLRSPCYMPINCEPLFPSRS